MPTHPHRRAIVAALLIALVLAGPAGAGVIRGELWLSRKAAKAAREMRAAAAARRAATTPARPAAAPSVTTPPRRGPLPEGTARAQQGVTDGVIYIEKVPDKVERKFTQRKWYQSKPAMARIVQSRLSYVPRVTVVTAGSEIEFENLDRVYHNTFSVAAARRFDLGKCPPGRRDTVEFSRRGVANLHCDIHPDEIGFVVVVPNHVFTRPDSLGRFALPKLPPGNYKLRGWHPRFGELAREVTMPRRGDVHLELTF